MSLPYLVAQGTLNRLRGSVVFGLNPELNVTAPYLGKEAISIAFEGPTAQILPTLTGGVTSAEPYQIATVTMHLLRTQALADVYKAIIELDSVIGPFVVVPDSDALGSYPIENAVIESVEQQTFDGQQPGMIVRLRGIYYINASLYLSA